jgi:hypothetical protein
MVAADTEIFLLSSFDFQSLNQSFVDVCMYYRAVRPSPLEINGKCDMYV